MKLTGPQELEKLLRAVEVLARSIPEVDALGLPVVILDDFAEFASLTRLKSLGTTPTLYQRSKKTIFVNRSSGFLARTLPIQEAIMLHELAHAYLHTSGQSVALGECIEADLLVCRWGHGEGIVGVRRADGDPIAEQLARVQEEGEDVIRVELAEQHRRRLLGLPT
jgi:hypothetical protein